MVNQVFLWLLAGWLVLSPVKASPKDVAKETVVDISSYSNVSGYLSAYDKNPTVYTIKYRQEIGDIPYDLSEYDGVITVLDCGRIGQEAVLAIGEKTLDVIVFDCAGQSDGGYAWMVENNIVAEVGWGIWQKYPDIVGKRATVTYGGDYGKAP